MPSASPPGHSKCPNINYLELLHCILLLALYLLHGFALYSLLQLALYIANMNLVWGIENLSPLAMVANTYNDHTE